MILIMVSLLTVLFHFRWNAATGSPWSTSLRKQNKTSNTCNWLLKISLVYRQIDSLNFMDFFTIKVGAIWYGEMLGKREALSLPVSLFRDQIQVQQCYAPPCNSTGLHVSVRHYRWHLIEGHSSRPRCGRECPSSWASGSPPRPPTILRQMDW